MKLGLILIILIMGQLAESSPSTLGYQGRILKSDGSPLEYSAVSFEFRITSPNGSCVIYREQKNGIDMTNSKGVFDTAIGTGTRLFPTDPDFSLIDAFSNSTILQCEGGFTFTPSVDDGRKLRVQFHDGAGWRSISPDNVIHSVPFAAHATAALTAQKLGVFAPADFVLKSAVPVCATGELLTSNSLGLLLCKADEVGSGTVTSITGSAPILAVSDGAGGYTISASIGTTANTLASGDDPRIVNAIQSGATAGGDLSGTFPNPTVSKIQNKEIEISSLSSGQFLKFNGTSWENATLSTTDISGPLGTVTSISATAPLSVTNNTTNPTLSMPPATGTDSGYLSSTDWSTFNAKQNALGFTPLSPANNLSELSNLATARTNLGLGTAAVLNTGTTSGQIPLIGTGNKLPSSIIPDVVGTAVTNTPSGNIAATTLQAAVNELDAEKVAKSGDTMTGTLQLPLNGLRVGTNQLYLSAGNVGIGTTSPSTKLEVVGSAKATEFCLGANCITSWPSAGASGTVTEVTSANTDISISNTTTTPVITLNSGVGANQILKLNSSSQLPAVSGVNLTNLNATNISSGTLPVARGGTGATSFSANRLVASNGTGNALVSWSCPVGQLPKFDSSGTAGCDTIANLLGYTPANGSNYVAKSGDTMTGRLGQSPSGFQVADKHNITTRTDSGFYQTDTATLAEGWPADGTWYHLLSTTHSNDGNYYSMQFAGDFYNSGNIFYRTTNNSGTTSWNRIWHSGNLTNLNQLSNGPGYLTGINSSQVTTALGYTPLRNTSVSGQGVGYNGAGGPEVFSAGGGASMISFHRPGAYGVNFGLDTDNQLKVGGWSMGGPHTIWHSGNFNPGSKLTLDAWNGSSYIATDGRHYGTIFYDTNDTNFYVDPNSLSQVSRIRTNSNWDGYQGGVMIHGNAPSITMHDTDTSIRWMFHNQDDQVRIYRANTANGTDWNQKIAFSGDGNIWSSYINDWIFNRLGQDVRAGTSPNFWNVWLGYRGGYISDVLDQDVRNNSSPSFNNPYVNRLRAGTGNNVYKVEVGGPLAFDGGLISRNSNNQMAFIIQSAWPGGAGWFWRRLDDLNNFNSGYYDPMILDPSGRLWTANGYTQASDIRLKKDFQEIPDSLRRVTELHGVYYTWKDEKNLGSERQIGLIAQEVEKVFPEMVTTNKEGYKAVAYQMLVAPIINALREVRDWMTKTDRDVAALQAENRALKEYLCSRDPSAHFCP